MEHPQTASRLLHQHPHVFPLVLAQGEKPWKTSAQLTDLVHIPEDMDAVWRPWQPTPCHHVMVLHAVPYPALTGSLETILMLRLLKAAREGGLHGDRVWDESLLNSMSRDARELWARYVYFSDINRKAFFGRVESLHSPTMKTKTLTLAERIKREALKEGRREGRREGRAEGARDAAWQAVLRALRARDGTIPEGLVEAVEQVEDISRLEMLLERAVLTSSLEEFAAGL